MEHERDAPAKHSLGEIEAERRRAILLENEVEELKQHLQLVETQYKEKVRTLLFWVVLLSFISLHISDILISQLD